MSADDWLKYVWLPLAVTVVGGLVVAAILAIFIKPVRERFWKPFGRALRWPFTLRLTTTKKLAAWDEKLDRLRWEVVTAGRESDHRLVTAELVGHKRGREEALAGVAAERATPLLQPTWRAVPLERDEYLLNNTQAGVIISNVSITCDPEEFEFVGANQWPGPFSGSQPFRGQKKRRGQRLGVSVDVRYQDERGDWQTGKAFIDREPMRAFVG